MSRCRLVRALMRRRMVVAVRVTMASVCVSVSGVCVAVSPVTVTMSVSCRMNARRTAVLVRDVAPDVRMTNAGGAQRHRSDGGKQPAENTDADGAAIHEGRTTQKAVASRARTEYDKTIPFRNPPPPLSS